MGDTATQGHEHLWRAKVVSGGLQREVCVRYHTADILLKSHPDLPSALCRQLIKQLILSSPA